MKTKIRVALLCYFLTLIPTSAFGNTDTTILVTKIDNTWTLHYTTIVPAFKIAFVNTPDSSRTLQWKPNSDEFEVFYQNHQEYIQRKDGKSFGNVSLRLTPVYKGVSKSYAPFAPLSDGSVLFHTGRLFACIEKCADDANGWQVTVEANEGEHIIANGHIMQKSASWFGFDDGQYVYIGKQNAIDKPSFVALIDDGLPKIIKTKLNYSLPKIMEFFETNLGELDGNVKPMLLASYSNKRGTDIQGGTLPNQIFIHWDMDNLESKVNDAAFVDKTLWMFAHEAAHLYQNNRNVEIGRSESWVHEGNAEWLAVLALRDMFPESIEPFIETKLSEAKAGCTASLKKSALADAASKGDYRAYYRCGLIIHALIDKKARKMSNGKNSIFTIWNSYTNSVVESNTTAALLFMAATEKYISIELLQGLKKLVNENIESPDEFVKSLDDL